MIGFRRVWINKRSGLFLLANGGTERGGAVAKVEFRQKLRTKPESTYLDVVRRNVTSQAGEDGLIQRIFSMIGASNKWRVEFGAWDGRHFSNSWCSAPGSLDTSLSHAAGLIEIAACHA